MKITLFTQPLLLQAVGWFLLVILLIVPAQGQTQEQEVFAEVPAPLRARLSERLKLLVEYQRTEQWAKLYDFLYQPTTSKEKYVEQNIRVAKDFGNIILDFKPHSATLLYPNSGWFFIKGCATQREKNGRIVMLEADVEARLQNEEWLLSPVGITIPIDGDPKPCSSQHQPAQKNGRTDARSSSRCSATSGSRNKERRQR